MATGALWETTPEQPEEDGYEQSADPEEDREGDVRLDASDRSAERDVRTSRGGACRIGLPFPFLLDGHERQPFEAEPESSGDMRRANDGRTGTLKRNFKATGGHLIGECPRPNNGSAIEDMHDIVAGDFDEAQGGSRERWAANSEGYQGGTKPTDECLKEQHEIPPWGGILIEVRIFGPLIISY